MTNQVFSYLQTYNVSAVEDFCESGDLQYHGNPSAATSMEEVYGPQGRLCWKLNHIWSNSTIASQSMNFSAHPRIVRCALISSPISTNILIRIKWSLLDLITPKFAQRQLPVGQSGRHFTTSCYDRSVATLLPWQQLHEEVLLPDRQLELLS